MDWKLIKDPIYGYVQINDDIRPIIDSPYFQRLRNIRQTSYAPLYPASVHNRFIHSIGVYHLGVIAYNSFRNEVINHVNFTDNNLDWKNIGNVFLLACLLHDIGHAPFSHTGESFYLGVNEKLKESIHEKLMLAVDSKEFSKDSEYYLNGKTAAPHEIMSALIGINQFGKYITSDENKEFFARCITGYAYQKNETKIKQIKNCLISILNSSVIDVDRLDYVIRDSFMTGFQNVSIDYVRLLNNITIVEDNGKLILAYKKSAMSIIENVIYAHDSERKWIQSHPVVLYEHFLVKYAISKVENYYQHQNKSLFSYETLLIDGNSFEGGKTVRLLSDEDVLYSMKNICYDNLIEEYFCRDNRRRPIWKSEAEYRLLFDNSIAKKKLDDFEFAFTKIEKYLIEEMSEPIINNNLIKKCEEEMNILKSNKEILPKSAYDDRMSGLTNLLKWAKSIEKFCTQEGVNFDFVVITTNKFKSGFAKDEVDKIVISFPKISKYAYIKDVLSLLDSKNQRNSFLYLFHKDNKKRLDVEKFVNFLIKELF